ncbi:MAG: hypothetical protein RL272_477 [Candidatus Parcubacteria bacterium]|jgi:sulfur carrier protein ThiS
MARKKSGSGKKKSGSKNTATLKVVPTQGSSTETSVTLAKGGTTAADALKAAGVSAERKNLSVGGKPVELSRRLNPGDVLTVEERPQGS